MKKNSKDDLQLATSIEKQVLRLDVSVGNTLRVKIFNAGKNLLEAALDLARRHASLLDGSVQVTARAILHDFAPMLILILHKVDGLNDVHMMQG